MVEKKDAAGKDVRTQLLEKIASAKK